MPKPLSHHFITASTENWDYYYCLIDDKPAIVSVDLNLVDQIPIERFPYLFYISLKIKNPNKDGLPTSTELIDLCRIEDALMECLFTRKCAIFSGRITSNGTRDLIFYVLNIEATEILIKSVLDGYPDLTYEHGAKEDAEWDFYIDFLFPSERELNSIYNHRYLAELIKMGDQPHCERTVTHTLYFPTPDDRDNFIIKAIDAYYQVERIDMQIAQEKYPWKVVISRLDQIETAYINKVTLLLLDLAKEYNGMYEGWVTVPVRSSSVG